MMIFKNFSRKKRIMKINKIFVSKRLKISHKGLKIIAYLCNIFIRSDVYGEERKLGIQSYDGLY